MELKKMMKSLAAVALCGLLAVPAGALEGMAGARFVDRDVRGSLGQVYEYNGKYFDNHVHGDAAVGNEGADGLFDLSVSDLGSTEENAYVNLDWKDRVKVGAKWENMHHRLNYINTGSVISGVYGRNPSIVNLLAPDQNLVMRRTESAFNLTATPTDDWADFLFAEYWRVDKVGSTTGQAASYLVDRANVDNTKEDITVAVGKGLGEASALAVELVRSEFKDVAEPVSMPLAAYPFAGANAIRKVTKGPLGRSEMTGGEMKFRAEPMKDLAVTAALTGKRRHSLQNGYSNDMAVAAFNAAYRLTPKLRLTGRMYFRANQVDEDKSFVPLHPANAQGNTHQLDKNYARTELAASYLLTEKVNVSGAYKLEYIHRRGTGPGENLGANGHWADGYVIPNGQYYNDIANDETRHNLKAGVKAELPLGMEGELVYKRLQANRSTFVAQPSWQNDASASLFAALPAAIHAYLMGSYIHERNQNHVVDRNYSSVRKTARTGVDWTGSQYVTVGADASYEWIRYRADVGFGSPSTAATALKTYREAGMTNNQRNTTTGAHARVNLPKGVVVTGNGSYTWSDIQTPMHYYNQTLGFTVEDYTPGDIRIARGSVGVEYTPEKWKYLTARASYGVDDWVDKFDTNNSGRVSIAQVGVSAKF